MYWSVVRVWRWEPYYLNEQDTRTVTNKKLRSICRHYSGCDDEKQQMELYWWGRLNKIRKKLMQILVSELLWHCCDEKTMTDIIYMSEVVCRMKRHYYTCRQNDTRRASISGRNWDEIVKLVSLSEKQDG